MTKPCLAVTMGLCLAFALGSTACSSDSGTTTTVSSTTTTLAPTTTTVEIVTTTTTTETPGAWKTTGPPEDAEDLPAGRMGGSLVYIPAGDQLLLFGGWDGAQFYNSVWRYDLAAGTWSALPTHSNVPVSRSLQALTYIPSTEQLVMFGGYDGGAYLGDTWVYDIAGDSWTSMGPSGPAPAPRDGHTLVYDPVSGKVILFGGWDGATEYGDLWAYDPTVNVWTELKPTGDRPAGRDSHAMAYDSTGKRMILFGGWNQSTDFADTWAYDPATNAWSALDPLGETPSSRALHQMVYETGTGKVLLFGGGTVGNAVMSDVWAYDPAGDSWARVDTGGTAPSARTGHGMAYDATGGRAFVFGGSDGATYFNDLWEFSR